MKAFEYEIAAPKRLIKFDNSTDFRGKPRVTPPPMSIVRHPSGVGTERPAGASSQLFAPPSAASRIEPFHPATGSGPPAPVAASSRRTQGSAITRGHPSVSSSSFGG
ncbi:hypothetical protein ACJ51O_19830 [Burkholderia pyrrocinia]|uniref:hypothetical protein n=1 Tax=Burkholderia pyrrocinia TaxID=60550 RepID=UPI0038B488BA